MTWATERLDLLLAGKAAPPPVVDTLKLGLFDEWGPGWARKTWRASPDVLQLDGTLFGGYIAALADQIAAFATMSVVPDGHGFRTSDLSVRFFKIARLGALQLEGRVVAQSRQTISVEVEIKSEEGVLHAKAFAQQIVTPLAAPRPSTEGA